MARADAFTIDMTGNGVAAGGPDAFYELGLMYATGRQVALDLIEAHKWFNLAALRGNSEAKRYRAEIASELSKAEIAEAQRLARQYLTQRH
jgi:hypothetical protein